MVNHMIDVVETTYRNLSYLVDVDLRERVTAEIDPKDGMLNGEKEEAHYMFCGASAIVCIMESLNAAGVAANDIRSVLDYACGYGRVLRWLDAAFPNAALIGMDADANAVKSANALLGVKTEVLDISLSKKLGQQFDLIWMGSLLTHLPESEINRVLQFVHANLASGGVLVVTVHGRLVYDRLSSGERLYGVTGSDAERMCSDYRKNGFGFSVYPKQRDYGVSITKPGTFVAIAEQHGYDLIMYKHRAWAHHQDLVCIKKSVA